MADKKSTSIKIRLKKKEKEKWKSICQEKKISLTDLIKDAVENRIFKSDRKEILTFIEKQDNIFSKIENNINQIAFWANSKKNFGTRELNSFTNKLEEIEKLKEKQNLMFKKIYHLISNSEE